MLIPEGPSGQRQTRPGGRLHEDVTREDGRAPRALRPQGKARPRLPAHRELAETSKALPSAVRERAALPTPGSQASSLQRREMIHVWSFKQPRFGTCHGPGVGWKRISRHETE